MIKDWHWRSWHRRSSGISLNSLCSGVVLSILIAFLFIPPALSDFRILRDGIFSFSFNFGCFKLLCRMCWCRAIKLFYMTFSVILSSSTLLTWVIGLLVDNSCYFTFLLSIPWIMARNMLYITGWFLFILLRRVIGWIIDWACIITRIIWSGIAISRLTVVWCCCITVVVGRRYILLICFF